jgi:hypothetical protein
MSRIRNGALAGAAGTALLNATTYLVPHLAYGAGVVIANDALAR